MPEAPSVTATVTAGASAASVPAFATLCREPVVLALLAACRATECHLVGGVLRDRMLGLATHDLDAVVAGRGGEIASELAARLPARLVKLGGKDFAAYRLVIGAVGASDPGGASDGTDDAVLSGYRILDLWDRQSLPLHDDLARRDFTVNSFALAPRGGAVIDPFGGLSDLERRVLRATTAQSFAGDPLRVLRPASRSGPPSAFARSSGCCSRTFPLSAPGMPEPIVPCHRARRPSACSRWRPSTSIPDSGSEPPASPAARRGPPPQEPPPSWQPSPPAPAS